MKRSKTDRGFTLIEVLVATFILVVMVMILSKIYHQANVAWSAGFRRADGNMTGRSAVGFMARELMNAVGEAEYLNNYNIAGGSSISFISLTGENASSERVARRITYEKSGKELKRTEQKATAGNYGAWGQGVANTMVTNVESLYFTLPSTVPYEYATLPEWIRIKLTIARSDDVSGVGSSSAGPDRQFGTADDVKSW